MQTLYTLISLEDNVKEGEPLKLLQKHFDQSKDLFQYILYFLTELGSYAETYSFSKSNKHLPTAEDLNINTKIAGNEILWKIKEEPLIKSEWSKSKPEHKIDKELVRKLYVQLIKTDEFQNYIATPSRDKKGEKEIIDFIFEQFLLPNEIFITHLEESFSNWDDDSEMVVQLIKNYLQKPAQSDLQHFVSQDKLMFARNLLKTVIEKNEHLESFILPKLKNWDAERLAALDMILMKMGIAEFLFFDTIPPKVTINEYIELAKDYSTAQSGQFVNGILDNIHKELVQQNKLHKVAFKKA
jgi:transcription antitermination protein NusB